MNLKSLSEDLKFRNGLYDMFEPTIRYRSYQDEDKREPLSEYEVTEEDEMRIDLVFMNIYELEPTDFQFYVKDIDVLCAINNIQNPLNIKKGMVIKYPRIGSFDDYRYTVEEKTDEKKKSIFGKLGVPKKGTRTDKARKKFQENNYILPPTVNKNPREPVIFDNGDIKIR